MSLAAERQNSATPRRGLKTTGDFPANSKPSPALAEVIWLAAIKFLSILVPWLARKMCEVPPESLSVERLLIT